jgi:hypothetical protein
MLFKLNIIDLISVLNIVHLYTVDEDIIVRKQSTWPEASARITKWDTRTSEGGG